MEQQTPQHPVPAWMVMFLSWVSAHTPQDFGYFRSRLSCEAMRRAPVIELTDVVRIIADSMPRHLHQEWIKFLKKIDAETPSHLDLHLLVDNYATHKRPKVLNWLKRLKRFHIHFIPTSGSRLNAIER